MSFTKLAFEVTWGTFGPHTNWQVLDIKKKHSDAKSQVQQRLNIGESKLTATYQQLVPFFVVKIKSLEKNNEDIL